MRSQLQLALGVGSFLLTGCSCGSDPDVARRDDNNFGGSAGTAGAGGAGASGGVSSGGTAGALFPTGGNGGSAGSGGTSTDPCANVDCGETQRCDPESGACVPNTCEELMCSGTTICTETVDGAFCEDISCDEQADCAETQYCNSTTGTCQDDECQAGELRCNPSDNSVLACDAFGGGEAVLVSCGGGSPYFDSTCSDSAGTQSGCSCEDDWDCPQYTECDAGVCVGTGIEPTCRLDPAPFSAVPPTNEITWGGRGVNDEVASDTTPFPGSSQLVLTPIVANLDDDNGDGRIDERDFPEIIFISFEAYIYSDSEPTSDHDFTENGTLRAIHGGGPDKGEDFFASCGSTLWQRDAVPFVPATSVSCNKADADLDSTATPAVGDLDYDGVPEIVAITEDDRIRIYSNRGEPLVTSEVQNFNGGNPGVTLANLDGDELVEIVIGRDVYTLQGGNGSPLAFLDHFEGGADVGKNQQGPVSCVANIAGDSRQEIVAGTTAYRFPTPPAGAARRADCTGAETDADEQAWCAGQLPELWDAEGTEGFCAIADVWGAQKDAAAPPGPSNPLDGVPEVVLVRNGHVDVIDAVTGQRITSIEFADASANDEGGAPNVDDFDGDGYPEVGTAGPTAYVLIDFQAPSPACPTWTSTSDDQASVPRNPPGASCATDADCGDSNQFACNETTSSCVCLHNNWRRPTQDDSSRVTGSSVFDFNGDGAAEVIYNDECYFRVYDGLAGSELFSFPSESRTRIEYPIVADVDNDGNAEIVFSTSNESGFCDAPDRQENQYNNGLEVWGEASDLWVSARRIWNQHAYHITNVTEGGSVPRIEPESWGEYNGRVYNSYRSNPRSFGVAPDLVIERLQVTSTNPGCGALGDEISITVQISNRGDLRVGPGVEIAFEGTWASIPLSEALNQAPGGPPLTATIGNSLEPGGVLLLTVSYDAANNSPGVLPDSITARVDSTGVERECEENNNELTEPVEGGLDLPDLLLEIGILDAADCPTPAVPTTVLNQGSVAVSNYVVRYYRGDPQAGGSVLHEVTRPGPLAPGAADSFTEVIQSFPGNAAITIYGVVDPDGVIEECNDGNNSDQADDKIYCTQVN